MITTQKVCMYGARGFHKDELEAFPTIQFCFFSRLDTPTNDLLSESLLTIYIVKNSLDLYRLYSFPLAIQKKLTVVCAGKKKVECEDCFNAIFYSKKIKEDLLGLFSCLFHIRYKNMLLTCNPYDFKIMKKIKLYRAKSVNEISSIINGGKLTDRYILYIRGSEEIEDEILDLPEVADTELDISLNYNYYDEKENDITVLVYGFDE